MAPRALWKGAISFGLVTIPVKLYAATESKDVSFHQVHSTCHSRLKQKRYCPEHGDIPAEEVGRAFEFAKDQYVIIDDADLERVPVPSLHTIEISRFIDLKSIDPIYFEKSYYLEPEEIGAKPFYLLKHSLEKTNRVAVAKVAFRNKEQLCCVRPFEKTMSLATMFYSDEVRATGGMNLPEEKVKVNPQEISMASSLIDHLTGPFEPDQYHDEFRDALLKLVEAKVGAGEPIVAAPAPPVGKVVDLMEALRASIEAAKKERTPIPAREQAESSKTRARAKKTA